MSEQAIKWYIDILHEVHTASSKEQVTQELLKQILLRDKLIGRFRTFLLSWDMRIPEHVPDELYERWEREQKNLLQSAAETLEGIMGRGGVTDAQ